LFAFTFALAQEIWEKNTVIKKRAHKNLKVLGGPWNDYGEPCSIATAIFSFGLFQCKSGLECDSQKNKCRIGYRERCEYYEKCAYPYICLAYTATKEYHNEKQRNPKYRDSASRCFKPQEGLS